MHAKQVFLLRPGEVAEYSICDQPVSLCVCKYISGTARPIFAKFCALIRCDRGSVLLRRRCVALCTSGFMDDITFGRNGPYRVVWPAWAASWTNRQLQGRVRCLRMPCFDLFFRSRKRRHSVAKWCSLFFRLSSYLTLPPNVLVSPPWPWKRAWSNWNLTQCVEWSQFVDSVSLAVLNDM